MGEVSTLLYCRYILMSNPFFPMAVYDLLKVLLHNFWGSATATAATCLHFPLALKSLYLTERGLWADLREAAWMMFRLMHLFPTCDI